MLEVWCLVVGLTGLGRTWSDCSHILLHEYKFGQSLELWISSLLSDMCLHIIHIGSHICAFGVLSVGFEFMKCFL